MSKPYRAFAAKGTGERADAIPMERPSSEFREGRWGMLVAPAATPKDIVIRLHAELSAVLGSDEIQEQILKLGMLPASGPSREELQPFINSEIERWGKIVRQVGLAGTM